ncbi:hypothetical protein FOA52_011502 [Chlamydomonas sp. UWO 241]|nr:hypothetical protein FOA52_011502 [Chlamydomonas sp. UWO 241]
MSDGAASASFPSRFNPALLNSYGWRRDDWDALWGEDAPFMDYAYLVARNSVCIQGHMGCVLTRGGQVLATATNTPLYKDMESDVHAEINVVAWCARNGIATDGTTAYVTRAPCKHCFGSLANAGVSRIVSPKTGTGGGQDAPDVVKQAAAALGIELVGLPDTDARRAAREALAAQHEDPARITMLREQRKALKSSKADASRSRKRRGGGEEGAEGADGDGGGVGRGRGTTGRGEDSRGASDAAL